MKLQDARQFVLIFDRIGKSNLPNDTKMALLSVLHKEFEKECLIETSSDSKPSQAEVQIALGTFNSATGHKYIPGTPDKIFAIKLLRSRSGLGPKEAKDAIESAMAEHFRLKPIELLDSEKESIKLDKQAYTFYRDSYITTVKDRTGCSYEQARDAVDQFCYTLNW